MNPRPGTWVAITLGLTCALALLGAAVLIWAGTIAPVAFPVTVALAPVWLWAAIPIVDRIPVRHPYQLPERASGPPDGRLAILYPVIGDESFDWDVLAATVNANANANPAPYIDHVVLFDYADADTQTTPGDATTLALGNVVVSSLASTLPEGQSVTLATRPRTWSEGEQTWMCVDRKRGKIDAFVRAVTDPYAPQEFQSPLRLAGLSVALTMDAGGLLSPGGAAIIMATMVGKPDIPPGYGAGQPSYATPDDFRPTRFEHLVLGGMGVHRGTQTVSPPQFARYGEAFFTGQGAFRIDAYANRVLGRIPIGSVLSHDKLEGFHMRTVAIPDVAIQDELPRTRLSRKRARERWSRGDWQLLPWVFGSTRFGRVRVRGQHRFWMAADMARVLERPAFCVVAIFLGLTGKTVGVLMVTLAFSFGALAPAIAHPIRVGWFGWARAIRVGALFLTTAVDDAAVGVTATARAWWRMGVSRHRLQQWAPSALVSTTNRQAAVGTYYADAWVSVVIAVVVAGVDVWVGGAGVLLVLCAAWVVGPWVSYVTDQPSRAPK